MRTLLDLSYRDPGLNLALDEVILEAVARGETPPTLRLWRNPRCVVVGRGQRVEDEVDLAACQDLRIPVLQRASGGGTVYHHPGNLNFSLFLPLVSPWTSVRESRNTVSRLLAQAIQERLGVKADERDGSVFVCGAKVSGSAQLRRRALLHHGTLLFAPDGVKMEDILLAHRAGYRPRGVPSRPSVVSDLSSLTWHEVTIEGVICTVLDAFRPLGGACRGAIYLREWALADARLCAAAGG